MSTWSLLVCLILQNSGPSVQELLGRIDALEKRIEQLEAERKPVQPGEAAPPPTVAVVSDAVYHEEIPPQATVSHSGMPPQATVPVPVPPAAVPPQFPSLELRGFSDFDFSGSDQTGSHVGFSEGQFTLHLVSALTPKVNFFSEITLTARRDAGLAGAPGFNPEVERSLIRFDQSDAFKVSIGRYHTPINWWNTTYHHGQWLQTTVSRPEMVQFGGSFIPIHFVGAQIEGTIPVGGVNLNYNAGLGNSRGPTLSRPADFGPINNDKAWLANISARPNHASGFLFGGSVYQDRINLPTGPPAFREWITSGHIVRLRETPEIIAEVVNIRHRDLAGILPVSNSQAFYVQSAYRLPLSSRAFKPYYRYEYIHVPKSDAVFRTAPNLNVHGSIIGLRYDLTEFAALKFEYRYQRRPPDLMRINSAWFQTSFTF